MQSKKVTANLVTRSYVVVELGGHHDAGPVSASLDDPAKRSEVKRTLEYATDPIATALRLEDRAMLEYGDKSYFVERTAGQRYVIGRAVTVDQWKDVMRDRHLDGQADDAIKIAIHNYGIKPTDTIVLGANGYFEVLKPGDVVLPLSEVAARISEIRASSVLGL